MCCALSWIYSGWIALWCLPLPTPASCHLLLLPSSPQHSCPLLLFPFLPSPSCCCLLPPAFLIIHLLSTHPPSLLHFCANANGCPCCTNACQRYHSFSVTASTNIGLAATMRSLDRAVHDTRTVAVHCLPNSTLIFYMARACYARDLGHEPYLMSFIA